MANPLHAFFVRLALLILVSLSAGPIAKADFPLADRVPGDAVVYVGWAGADSQAVVYRDSNLSAFVDQSNLAELARQYLPGLWKKLAGDSDDNARQAVAALQRALPVIWHHPVALYASHVTIQPDGTPQADVALVCDAGDDAGALKSDLEQAIAGNPQLHVAVRGSVVILGLNQSADAPLDSALADNPKFVATMHKLPGSPAIAVYVDVKTVLQKVDASTAADPDSAEIWPKVRDALGIGGCKTFAITGGFENHNWITASLLEAPSPRTGLLAAIEPKPIDPVLLSRIPATAETASVCNLDLAKLYDTIGDAMAVTKQNDTTFHQATGLATMALGRNFRRQILGPLGPQWVFYSDAELNTSVVLNHPNDSDMAEDSLVSATFGLTNLTNSRLPGAATQPVVTAEQKTVKGIDLTTAVTQYASPTFATSAGVLYLGLAPDSVVSAANAPAVKPGVDLTHSASFVAAVQRLGVQHFAAFDYCDLPRTAPQAYEYFGPFGVQVRQLMRQFNIQMPTIKLPPIEQLKAHLSPALSVSWADADGVYSRSISPFPLSTHLLGSGQQAMVSGGTASGHCESCKPARVQHLLHTGDDN